MLRFACPESLEVSDNYKEIEKLNISNLSQFPGGKFFRIGR